MINIRIWAMLDKTAVSIEFVPLPGQSQASPAGPVHLLTAFGEVIAHSETMVLTEVITDALHEAEEEACALGGWSVLA